jgi:2-polyprenyl-6-methoxyphenol hydroxylase-like FAD-dependent oxidoreductase
MIIRQTEVLVIGAGPTGLALAATLQKAGLDHLAIDTLPERRNTSRAAVIHAHTLETLDSISVSEELVARGLKLENFAIRDRDRALLSLSFADLPSRYPFILMIPQQETETILAARLQALGSAVSRGVTATNVRQGSHSVEVATSSPEGQGLIRARYVVGADGMKSLVRTAAGIPFAGGAYGESFILADVEMEWPLGESEVTLYYSPAGLVVVSPFGDRRYRIVATVDAAPETPTLGDVQSILDARGPRTAKAKVLSVNWSSRFHVHHRLAKTFRAGRLFLIGDAAHVHSPAGGQGMNCGLVDACELGRLLADVVHGARSESDLDLHTRLRRPAAAGVLKLAGMLTRVATVKGPLAQGVRNLALRIADHVPATRRKFKMGLSGLARADLSHLPTVTPRRALRPPA